MIKLKEDKNVRAAKIMKVAMFKQALGEEVISTLPECFMRINSTSIWLTVPLPGAINQNLLTKSLIEAIVKSRRVYGIKVQVCRGNGLFQENPQEMAVPPLADSIMGMNTVCDLTLKNTHVGDTTPLKLRGTTKEELSTSIKRSFFRVQKVTGINKQISPCAPLRWPAGSRK